MGLGQSVCPAEYVVAAALEPCQTHLWSGKGGVRAEVRAHTVKRAVVAGQTCAAQNTLDDTLGDQQVDT